MQRLTKKRWFKVVLVIVLVLITIGIVSVGILIQRNQSPESSSASTINLYGGETCARVYKTYGSTPLLQSFCTGSYKNPIQEAINAASQLNGGDVVLSAGTFYLKEKVMVPTPASTPAAIYIPSGIKLIGSGTGTILRIDSSVDKVDVVIYAGADKTNAATPLKNTEIRSLVIDAQTGDVKKAVVGIWVGETGSGVNIKQVTVQNTIATAMIIGYLAQYQQSATNNNQAQVYRMVGDTNNFNQIIGNRIENAGGDGIAVTGENVLVQGNTVQGVSASYGNGITTFTTSKNILIKGNILINTSTGIGLDGSYPKYYKSSVNQEDFMKAMDESGIGNQIGFGSYVTIEGNNITNCQHGVVLWRQLGDTVKGNIISGSQGDGILFNETRDSYAVGNTISGVDNGITLKSLKYSTVGTVYDGIGVYKKADGTYPILGNQIRNVKNGILFVGDPDFVKGNTMRSNVITNASVKACTYLSTANNVATGNTPDECNIK